MATPTVPKATPPPKGQSTVSSSYEFWEHRLEKGGQDFNRHTEHTEKQGR